VNPMIPSARRNAPGAEVREIRQLEAAVLANMPTITLGSPRRPRRVLQELSCIFHRRVSLSG